MRYIMLSNRIAAASTRPIFFSLLLSEISHGSEILLPIIQIDRADRHTSGSISYEIIKLKTRKIILIRLI